MDHEKGKIFYEQTNAIHNLMLNFEFMYKQCLKLGRVECDLLQFLLREKRAVSMKEVANFMDVSHSRITHLMDSLIKKNYLKRIPSKEDRRVFYAEITPEGKEIAKKYKEKNIKMFEDFLKKMPEDQIEPIYDTLMYWKQFLIKMNEVLMDSRNA
ncbi:MAG: MarR family transcriptional regulator [Candidatus Cloacimonetes bacterium]|jgi:DNA-binding MarR family transcriptional regulator|nr:MarR family transcriptional regulator [Candidatus Cloacimonadota bacterium]MDD4155520.1 MarR family transcriptional regulator [Candidatus Cloacimonadota bacterium]